MGRAARRIAAAVSAGFVVALAAGGPAAAHGIGARGDLPLPVWQVVWAAAVVVVVSFGALGLVWLRPRLAGAAEGRALPARAGRILDVVEWPARLVVLCTYVVVASAGLVGVDNSAVNVAPVAVFVIFWVGLPVVSAVLGGFWARLSPFDTVVTLVDMARGQRVAGGSAPVGTVGLAAVVGIAGFLWLELAYHSPASPRVLGWALVGYAVAMVGGGLRFGRAWLRSNDGFVVLTSLVGSMAPLYRRGDGALAVRVPFTGLATVQPGRWLVSFVAVVLGGTTFDGFTGVDLWGDIIGTRSGWSFTGVSTLGFAWAVAAVAAAYHGAAWLAARVVGRTQIEVADEFAPSLVPIVLAYSVAHYFSLLVFEGQNFFIQASDPYGRGWNLFGTQDWSVDYLAVSTTTIAWVQVVSIVVGHVAGVTVAHDRAVERHRGAVAIRSQYPLLAVMVAYTVVGLVLLLNA